MIRRVSSSNFILDDVLDKQEELEQDGASFFDRGHDGVALSSFWQGVQRGLFVSEGHQRNSKPNSSRVILNNVDEEEVRIGLSHQCNVPSNSCKLLHFSLLVLV